MNLSIAAYAGSMDPITLGHLDIIVRASRLFEKLVVLIANDVRKKYMFSLDERVFMARSVTAHLGNVVVLPCDGVYVVKQARALGAGVLIRGIRNARDLDDEQILARENGSIAPTIETLWMPCQQALMHVSSTVVKMHVGADPMWESEVSRLVPPYVLSQLKEKYMLSSLRMHWTKLLSSLGNPEGGEEVFADLLARYREPHRYYHNLTHILSVLDECSRIGSQDDILLFAIWFHDAIYDTKSDLNETHSAELAANALRILGQNEVKIKEVETLILSTKQHSASLDQRTQLLIDLDLMILGGSAEEYDAYEQAIRSEYVWVPENIFRKERSRILNIFLERPTIYSTKHFIQKFEKNAQANLQQAIASLGT